MSVLTKKMHVHFDDDVVSEKKFSDHAIVGPEEPVEAEHVTGLNTFNYTRDVLLKLAESLLAKLPPKIDRNHDGIADEKRKEKINFVLKTNANRLLYESKLRPGNADAVSKNIGSNSVVENVVSDQQRTNFQVLMAAAASQNQIKKLTEHAEIETRQRRAYIGSGRFVDNVNAKDPNNIHNFGIDYRYSQNEFFADKRRRNEPFVYDERIDAKFSSSHERGGGRNDDRKFGRDFNWNKDVNRQKYGNQYGEHDNFDAKSDEPEWANCGPISKHDIIELHGFDGPSGDDEKSKDIDSAVDDGKGNGYVATSPPARSTPSKSMFKKSHENVENESYFNFEDFLKLEIPAGIGGTGLRETDPGESRFKQWFRRDTLPNQHGTTNGNVFDNSASINQTFGSTKQFFDHHHQKASMKKIATNLATTSAKFRSVEELEADLCPPNTGKQHQANCQQPDLNAFKNILKQIAGPYKAKRGSFNQMQSTNLLNLINKNAESLYHYQSARNLAMKRPDAQLLLHRLVNSEITQLQILQQINNPNIHQRDRETFIAVLNFCNDNKQWLQQQQQQQLKHKQQMTQQLCQLQMLNMKNGQPPRSPTLQELQYHTQVIMQNALFKKNFEEKCRKQQMQPMQAFKPNHFTQNPQAYPRLIQKQKFQPFQNFQLMQPPNNPIFGRQLQYNPNKNLPFNASGSTPTTAGHVDAPVAITPENN